MKTSVQFVNHEGHKENVCEVKGNHPLSECEIGQSKSLKISCPDNLLEYSMSFYAQIHINKAHPHV